MTTTRGHRALVTGGAGFIGSNLADRLASEGVSVAILDSLARPGVERNLAWLKARHGDAIVPYVADVRESDAVADAARDADCIYHLAAQVAVTTSLSAPMEDFAVNLTGTLNVLEAARRAGRQAPVIFASTNKVYGDLADVELNAAPRSYEPVDQLVRDFGVSERRRLDFHTPYGCSKGAADQYVLDYARSFDVPSVVFRMSCIYGPRQMGTEDQGWVAHFLIRALEGQTITIYGDGRQVRDILFVEDAIDAYVAAWRRIGDVSGQAFNLGGGPRNAVSLRHVLTEIEQLTGRSPRIDFAPWRQGDQRYYVSDTRKVLAALDLPAPGEWRAGLGRLHDWLSTESTGAQPRAASEHLAGA